MENDTPMPGKRETVPIDDTAHDIVGEIEALSTELERRDAELAALERAREESQGVIAELRAQVDMYHSVADERAAVIATLDQALISTRVTCADHPDEIARLTRERDALTLSAEAASRAFEDERLRGRLSTQQLDAALKSAQRELASVQSRFEALEASLVSRGEVVAMLQTTCDERMAVIERLSVEVDSLRQVAEDRGRLLAELSAPSEAGAFDWQAVAEERERALTALSAEAEHRAVLLAELTAALEARSLEVEELRKRPTRVS